MKIGVFDSGLGGMSVAQAIEKALPEHEVIFRHDQEHFPYGSKKPEELLGYVEPILHGLIRSGCAVIVIACNTVSTTIIEELRRRVAIHLVAIEPMVKPAAERTKSGVIAVCATPTTLKSERYHWLKDRYAKDVKVLEPNCASWSKMIEERKLDRAMIDDTINDVLTLGADVIVLGCTHYHWIEDEIKEIAKDRAEVIQPEPAIINEVTKQLKLLRDS
jgi:glutamate racemase